MVRTNRKTNFHKNQLKVSDSTTTKRNPNPENELLNKQNVDDELDKNTILIFNQTLQNNLKISVGNIICSLTKNDRKQVTDTTATETGNAGG